MKGFRLVTSDVGFAVRSDRQLTYDFVVRGTPEAVFEVVTEPARLAAWLPDLRGARWLGGDHGGRGALREVRVRGLWVHEQVLVYRPGDRFAFTVTRCSAPILREMVEDYRFEAAGPGHTRVIWTVAYQPILWARPLERVLRPAFSTIFRKGSDNLIAHFALGR